MSFTFKSLKQIIDLFENNNILGASQISNILGKSRSIIHKYLKELVKQKILKKIGKGPQTKYIIINHKKSNNIEGFQYNIGDDYIPDYKIQKKLDEIFYKFSPEGEILQGFLGMKKWCITRNLNLEEKIKNYISIDNHIEKLQNECGLLEVKNIFGKHFEKVYLDNIFYADQYNRMEFGRGKLAEMTFYAKQSQNKDLINKSIDSIILKLECIIKKKGFDSIAITPWSIDRKNQFLHFFKKRLEFLGLPFVNFIKYYPNNIAIPQKSLKTREQRIQNARNTIFVDNKNIKKYKKIFLIDDFVGSGSTLNETAAKLKQEGILEVWGFALVGNMNLEYDVINEV